MELGVFNPIYRNHATKGSRDREPWVDGAQHEAIRRRYIETRYQLLPYIYTGLEESSRTGIPLMRPLFLEFPQDATLQTIDSEFMFGSSLLIAPKVVEIFGPYEIRMPPGMWYDFWTGKQVDGRSQNVEPALDVLPVYVRGGSILPQQAAVQNTDERPQGPLEISVYPGPDCRGSLYQDDGNTLAYTRGEFLRMQFSCDARPDSLRFRFSTLQQGYKPWWTSMKIVFFGLTSQPRQLSLDGKTLGDFQFDAAAGTVTVNLSAAFEGEIAMAK